jgi:hypothetical protein
VIWHGSRTSKGLAYCHRKVKHRAYCVVANVEVVCVLVARATRGTVSVISVVNRASMIKGR